MVLGVGGFAQAVMQILSDDGAEVSCALTRNYAHAAPAFAGPTHDLAAWKGTVSYEVLVGWRSRLPRIHLGGETAD